MTQTLLDHYKIEKKLNSSFIEYSRYVLDRGTEAERAAYAEGFVTKLSITKGDIGASK